MADVERSGAVFADADRAFAYVADPAHLPEYVPVMELVDTDAEEGDAAAEAGEPSSVAPTFVPDAGARRITWGRPGTGYAGSLTVEAATSASSRITIRLHVRDDADTAEIEKLLDQSIRSLQRRLLAR